MNFRTMFSRHRHVSYVAVPIPTAIDLIAGDVPTHLGVYDLRPVALGHPTQFLGRTVGVLAPLSVAQTIPAPTIGPSLDQQPTRAREPNPIETFSSGDLT